MHTKTVLMVSKPVAPPWSDSAKNLVRDIVCASSRHRYRVMVPRGQRLSADRVSSAEIYGEAGAYSPGLRQNARVLAHLLTGPAADIVHYFFAPNPRTSGIARLVHRLRRRPTVQTVCSAPASYDRPNRLLFADRVVVVSEDTRRRFVEAGIDAERLRLIYPGIVPLAPLTADEHKAARARWAGEIAPHVPVVLYAGDYQFSQAARTVATAIGKVLPSTPARFVFACRIKQEASREEERRIRSSLEAAGLGEHVRFYNDVDDMRSLLGACDLCLMPAESLYAKMDIPLVVLEAMSLGVPVIVADKPPLTELLETEVGVGVTPRDSDALAHAIRELAHNVDRRRAMGERARHAVSQRFSATAAARAYEDLYDEVI